MVRCFGSMFWFDEAIREPDSRIEVDSEVDPEIGPELEP